MKREIVCLECSVDLRKRYPARWAYPDEHVKFVNGTAKKSFICDNCGVPIAAGAECAAVSIWADYGGIAYFPWESDFLDGADTGARAAVKPVASTGIGEIELVDHIHRAYKNQKYTACKKYCEDLIRLFPDSEYVDFATRRIAALA